METISTSQLYFIFFTSLLHLRLSASFPWTQLDIPVVVHTARGATAWLVVSAPYGTSYPKDAAGFPNPYTDPTPEQPCGHEKGWVCDPDKVLSGQEGIRLNDKIETTISEAPCVCRSCRKYHPKGRYSIGVAIVGNITGGGSNTEKALTFSQKLLQAWGNMKRCGDMLVITVDVGANVVAISTDPLVAKKVSSECIKTILEKVRPDFTKENYITALVDIVDYIANALNGGKCGTTGGLSAGQIAGIVIGVIAGVALIVGLVLCCIGFCNNWECVVGTCIGICIGMILGAIQAFINALIFALCRSLLAECGCDDCCECEPLDCVPEDSGAGGAIEY